MQRAEALMLAKHLHMLKNVHMIEAWRRQTATEFADIVQRAVKPFEHGGYGRATVEMSGLAVRYTMYDLSNIAQSIDGVSGLGFDPKYAVDIAINQEERKRRLVNPRRPEKLKPEETATFGLKRHMLMRTLQLPDPTVGISFPLQPTELDEERAEALIDFIRAPHLLHDALDTVLKPTAAEVQELTKRKAYQDARAAQYAQAEAAIRPVHRSQGDRWFRMWADGMDRRSGRLR